MVRLVISSSTTRMTGWSFTFVLGDALYGVLAPDRGFHAVGVTGRCSLGPSPGERPASVAEQHADLGEFSGGQRPRADAGGVGADLLRGGRAGDHGGHR